MESSTARQKCKVVFLGPRLEEVDGRRRHSLDRSWRRQLSLRSLRRTRRYSFPHLGHEVSKYVEKFFIGQLVKLEQYKKKNYVAALDEAFRLMDELLEST